MRGSETAEKVQGGGMKSTLMIFAITGFFLTLWGFLPDVHRSAISIALLRPLTGLMCLLGIIAERRWAKLTFAAVGQLLQM